MTHSDHFHPEGEEEFIELDEEAFQAQRNVSEQVETIRDDLKNTIPQAEEGQAPFNLWSLYDIAHAKANNSSKWVDKDGNTEGDITTPNTSA